MINLKQCPFCGSSVTMSVWSQVVDCDKCGTSYPDASRWQSRPIEDDLRADLAALKAELLGATERLARYGAMYDDQLTDESAGILWRERR